VTEVHFVLPGDIDDPATPSGGNVYDRRISLGLAALGWRVREHALPGLWPDPADPERAALGRVLAERKENSLVLVDGLIASAVPEILGPHATRLRLVILVHLPLENDAEGAALRAADAVAVTSQWSRGRLLELYSLSPERVHVATPGVDLTALASGSASGRELLCVAAVTVHKGHEVLASALAELGDLSWHCVCVGSLTREPELVKRLPDYLGLAGPLTGQDLDAAYARADLLVLPSRGETYGMVVTEALARGIPVLATNAGGVPEALGHAPDGSRPGLLTGPGDASALASALRLWLTNPATRQRLRTSAQARRGTLTGWAETSARVAKVLDGVRAG
jgi:glycosyltransferase involved in cell wall biosynthesis